MKFQIRVYSRFENFTNQLVVRSPRSGGTRSGCNPRERCGERSGADFATTVLQLGEGAENRSRNFQFSTDLSKTAWCCELTIFLAKTKRFLRQSKPKFSTYTELRSFAKLPVICSAFCSVGLEICRSSGGKFILFWRRAKDGREKLFCSLWFCGGWSGLQMCFSLCVGLFCLFCDEGCKKYKIGLEFYK